MYRINSNIEPSLIYNIAKDIDDQDTEENAAFINCVLINSFKMYLITGKPNYNFEYDKMICYFNIYYDPTYSGKDEEEISSDLTKIGIYEIIIKDGEVPEVPDFDNPKSLLFFPWVSSRISSNIYPVKTLKDITDKPEATNKKFKLIQGMIDDPPTSDEEESDSDDDIRKAIELSLKSDKPKVDSTTLDKSIEQLTLGSSTNWINKYLKNTQYQIIGNEGGGNCFFLSVATALKSNLPDREKTNPNIVAPIVLEILRKNGIEDPSESIKELKSLSLKFYPKNTSQNDSTAFALRVLLYLSATMEEFTNQKILSDEILITELADLEKTIANLVKAQENPPAGLSPMQVMKFQEEKITQLVEYLELQENPANLLPPELKDFVMLKDFNDYQNYLLTDQFWADTTAINKLELFLNVKFIIFRYPQQGNGGIECLPNLTDPSIEESKVFKPDYYIMINWLEPSHYELVEYDGIALLNWSNLPKEVKEIIINKCGNKDSAGSFKYIPQIKTSKSKSGGKFKSKKNKDNKQRLTRKN